MHDAPRGVTRRRVIECANPANHFIVVSLLIIMENFESVFIDQFGGIDRRETVKVKNRNGRTRNLHGGKSINHNH